MNNFVHYTDIGKNRLDIKCNNCGHAFEYGKPTPNFCPSCGGKFDEEKYNNIPMSIVPNGMKAYLYKKYELYHNEYYNNTDNWGEIIEYLKIIYNIEKMNLLFDNLATIVKGYSLVNKKELCFISDDNRFIGFYDGGGKQKNNIKIYSIDEFKEELLKLSI